MRGHFSAIVSRQSGSHNKGMMGRKPPATPPGPPTIFDKRASSGGLARLQQPRSKGTEGRCKPPEAGAATKLLGVGAAGLAAAVLYMYTLAAGSGAWPGANPAAAAAGSPPADVGLAERLAKDGLAVYDFSASNTIQAHRLQWDANSPLHDVLAGIRVPVVLVNTSADNWPARRRWEDMDHVLSQMPEHAEVDVSDTSGRMVYRAAVAEGGGAAAAAAVDEIAAGELGQHTYNTTELPREAIRTALSTGRPYVRWTIGMANKHEHPWKQALLANPGTVVLLHPPLNSVGVPIWIERWMVSAYCFLTVSGLARRCSRTRRPSGSWPSRPGSQSAF